MRSGAPPRALQPTTQPACTACGTDHFARMPKPSPASTMGRPIHARDLMVHRHAAEHRAWRAQLVPRRRGHTIDTWPACRQSARGGGPGWLWSHHEQRCRCDRARRQTRRSARSHSTQVGCALTQLRTLLMAPAVPLNSRRVCAMNRAMSWADPLRRTEGARQHAHAAPERPAKR